MSKREIVDIDDLNLDPEDYKKYNGRRIIIDRGQVVIVMSNSNYLFRNIIMDKEYTRFIHKDGNDFNFSRSNLIEKPNKKVVKIKKDRLCKDCGQGGLEPRYKYCESCGIKRIYNSKRKGK